jgi:hypothetical protein
MSRSASTLPVEEKVMVDLKGTKASTLADVIGMHAKNAISGAMEDLIEDDWKEIECELDEERVERCRRKLA